MRSLLCGGGCRYSLLSQIELSHSTLSFTFATQYPEALGEFTLQDITDTFIYQKYVPSSAMAADYHVAPPLESALMKTMRQIRGNSHAGGVWPP
jgi:hypothetical protein